LLLAISRCLELVLPPGTLDPFFEGLRVWAWVAAIGIYGLAGAWLFSPPLLWSGVHFSWMLIPMTAMPKCPQEMYALWPTHSHLYSLVFIF
jgi:hypothetical protein